MSTTSRRHTEGVTGGRRSGGTRWRRVEATARPAAMALAMSAVFGATTERCGPRRAYQAGFAVDWACCWVTAGLLVGPRRLAEFWRVTERALPRPYAARPVRGWLSPALGFTAWHLVPLTAHPSTARRGAALLAA